MLSSIIPSSFFFFFNDTATTEIYTLSLHDALPIFLPLKWGRWKLGAGPGQRVLGLHLGLTRSMTAEVATAKATIDLVRPRRSEEHTSELQSPCNLVCRLLLEKKKKYRHKRKSDDNT